MKFHGVDDDYHCYKYEVYTRISRIKPNNELIFIVLAVTVNVPAQEHTILQVDLDSCTINTVDWFLQKGGLI